VRLLQSRYKKPGISSHRMKIKIFLRMEKTERLRIKKAMFCMHS